jgi:hypothetical protein
MIDDTDELHTRHVQALAASLGEFCVHAINAQLHGRGYNFVLFLVPPTDGITHPASYASTLRPEAIVPVLRQLLMDFEAAVATCNTHTIVLDTKSETPKQ